MNGLPQRYVVMDTESTERQVEGRPMAKALWLQLGVAIIRDVDSRGHPTIRRHRFTTSEGFRDLIDAMPLSRQPIVVFAHRMDHDIRQVEWLRWMGLRRYTSIPPKGTPDAGRFRKPLFIMDGPLCIVQCFRPDGQRVLFLDSVMWLEKSIKHWGAKIGLPKLVNPGEEAPDEDRFRYCERDAEILHRCLERLWRWMDDNGLRDFPNTPGILARTTYRARYEAKRITPPEEVTLLEMDRHGYYGAIIEPFHIGRYEGPIHKLDVTNLYPYVMSKNLFPCKFSEQGDFSAQTTVPDQFDPSCCTAEVYLDSPWLPWPIRGSNATLHVTGRVRTILCGPELVEAFKADVVRKVGRWIRWETDDLFSGFIAEFWRERLKARRAKDPIGEHMAKSLMVKLHGKFGQRTHGWMPTGKNHDANLFCQGFYSGDRPEDDRKMRVVAGDEEMSTPEGEDPNGFVPIASWTVSYGRVYMWELIHTAGLDNVYHVATDSILCNGIGLGNLQLAGLVQDDVLGLLHYEGSEEWAEIHGQNAIDYPHKKVRQGVKLGSYEIGPDHWLEESWESASEAIYRDNISSTIIEHRYKNTSQHASRRKVLADGSTIPWSLSNWDVSPKEQLMSPVRARELGENA